MAEQFSEQPVGEIVQSCPFRDKKPEHWIEIELVGEDGKPIEGAMYVINLPDGKPVTGYLDSDGWARVENIQQSGDCQVSFPRLDATAWKLHPASPLDARGASAAG